MAEVDHTTEIWKRIPSFPDYEASSLGRVRCPDRRLVRLNKFGAPVAALHKGRILRQMAKSTGYLVVSLRLAKDDWKIRMVHGLVCEAFHGLRPEGKEVAHINGVRDDNRPSNLRWATKAENCADKIAHGTQQIGARNVNSVLRADDIPIIRDMARTGKSLAEIAVQYGVSKGCIQHAVKGLNWKHVPDNGGKLPFDCPAKP